MMRLALLADGEDPSIPTAGIPTVSDEAGCRYPCVDTPTLLVMKQNVDTPV